VRPPPFRSRDPASAASATEAPASLGNADQVLFTSFSRVPHPVSPTQTADRGRRTAGRPVNEPRQARMRRSSARRVPPERSCLTPARPLAIHRDAHRWPGPRRGRSPPRRWCSSGPKQSNGLVPPCHRSLPAGAGGGARPAFRARPLRASARSGRRSTPTHVTYPGGYGEIRHAVMRCVVIMLSSSATGA